MAIPFLIGGAAAFVGTGVIVDTKEKMDRANDINNDAQRIAKNAEKRSDKALKAAKETIDELGKTKVSIMADSIKKFVDNFSRIKNVRLTDSIGLEELRGFNPDSPDFRDMKDKSLKLSDVATGVMGGTAAGTATAVGVYSAVGAFGAASTGTAISALSGAAATNATLAWLGGGSLAAGGFGMAGGMAVLGGLVAIPALAITGLLLSSKADKALNEAKENREKARKYEQDAKNLCTAMEAIGARAEQIKNLLNDLNYAFRPLVSGMISTINRSGVDWRNYSRDEQTVIGMAAQLAKTIKVIVDTSLITEDGKLRDAETAKVLSAGRALLNG